MSSPPPAPAVDCRPCVVALPGAGSTGELLQRLFGPAVAGAGLRLVAADHPVEVGRTGPTVEDYLCHLDTLIGRYRPVLLAGVSMGAHLVARWSAQRCAGEHARRVMPQGLLLAAPAWTGAPDQVARLSAWSAGQLRELGLPAVLAQTRGALRDGSLGDAAWVAEELLLAWPGYPGDALARQLEVVAGSAAPSGDELASLELPVGLLAWRADHFHPEQVAHDWAQRLPRAVLDVVELAAPAAERALVGHRLLAAVREAGWTGAAGR